MLNHQGSAGFTSAERRLLQALGSQIDTAIFESLEQYHLRQVLGRSVGPQVMERLLIQRDVAFLKGERCLVSVLYADIRGSTHLAEHTDPELLVGFINDYLLARWAASSVPSTPLLAAPLTSGHVSAAQCRAGRC